MLFLLLVPAIEGFLLYRLMNYLLTYKFSDKTRYLPGILTCLILVVRWYLFRNLETTGLYTLSKIGGLLLILLTVVYFYREPLLKKLSIFLLYFFINIIVELLLVLLLFLVSGGRPFQELLQDYTIQRIVTYFSKVLMFFAIEYLCLRRKKMKQFTLHYAKELGFILVYNIMAFLILMHLLLSDAGASTYDSELLFIVAVNVFFISVVSSLIIIKVTQRSKKELQYQLALQQMELELKSNEDLDKMMNKIRSFRHDTNNHFGVMTGLLHQQQYKQLDAYLTNITTDLSAMNQMVLYENKALTALLNNKLAKAYMNNITLEPTISVQDHPLSDPDLCGILGNMLDNAIEACQFVPKNKTITLSIQQKGSQYRISCINPYTVEPVKHNDTFRSTKENSNIHGFGIENIKHIANKYDGEVTISYHNQIFTIHAMIQA